MSEYVNYPIFFELLGECMKDTDSEEIQLVVVCKLWERKLSWISLVVWGSMVIVKGLKYLQSAKLSKIEQKEGTQRFLIPKPLQVPKAPLGAPEKLLARQVQQKSQLSIFQCIRYLERSNAAQIFKSNLILTSNLCRHVRLHSQLPTLKKPLKRKRDPCLEP